MYPLTDFKQISVSESTVHAGTYQYILVHAGLCWYVLVCTGMYQYVLLYWYKLVYAGIYTGIYVYIPACTVLSDAELSVRGYNTVQGGTMKYPKVILVYAGTCWCIPVYTGIYHHVLCFETLKFL